MSRQKPYTQPTVRIPKQTAAKMHAAAAAAAETALKSEIAAHAATRAALGEAINLIQRMVRRYGLVRNSWSPEDVQRLEHWRALSLLP
jgi:hypothetical protein